MKNYVDIKTTIWQRAWFKNDTNMNEIVDLLNNSYTSDIYDNSGFVENEILFDTEEILHPIDNNGNSTIEVFENDKLIWGNT